MEICRGRPSLTLQVYMKWKFTLDHCNHKMLKIWYYGSVESHIRHNKLISRIHLYPDFTKHYRFSRQQLLLTASVVPTFKTIFTQIICTASGRPIKIAVTKGLFFLKLTHFSIVKSRMIKTHCNAPPPAAMFNDTLATKTLHLSDFLILTDAKWTHPATHLCWRRAIQTLKWITYHVGWLMFPWKGPIWTPK